MLATTIVVCIGRLYSCSRAEFAISTDWLVKVITPEFPSTDELEPDQALQFTPSEQKIFDSMSALLAKAGLDYQGHFVEVNGQRIHYLDYGDGPPVLLLHGGGAGSAIWFKQIAGLSKTHRVIAPDHPVFGLSAQEAYESPFVGSLVRYLTVFMDKMELDRADLAGLSMGAQGALVMAIESPERVNRLLVIDSAGLGKSFPMIFRLGTIPLIGPLIVRPNRWGQDNYFKTMEVVRSDFDSAVEYKQYAYDITLPPEHAAAMRSSLKVITNMGGQKVIFTDDELRSIAAETLIIWGARDKVFPVEHGFRLGGLVPDSRLHVVEDSAHVPLLDNAVLVNELVVGFFGND